MSGHARSLTFAMLFTGPFASATAQEPVLAPGARIRVSAAVSGITNVSAVLTDVRADSLMLVPSRTFVPVLLAWEDVTALEVRQRRNRRAGALRGAAWGTGVGMVVGLISLATPQPEGEDFSETALAAEAVLDFAIVGALIGLWRPGSRWRVVDVTTARSSARRGAPLIARVSADSAARPAAAASEPAAFRDPIVAVTLGLNAPQLPTAQFPGLTAAIAANLITRGRAAGAVVSEVDLSYLRSALMGGARVSMRDRSAPGEHARFTSFAQVVGGRFRAERSGVVHSSGGTGIQPGAGMQYGRGPAAVHAQVDYRHVPNGFVDDDRVSGRHVASLSGMRVLAGATFRLGVR